MNEQIDMLIQKYSKLKKKALYEESEAQSGGFSGLYYSYEVKYYDQFITDLEALKKAKVEASDLKP